MYSRGLGSNGGTPEHFVSSENFHRCCTRTGATVTMGKLCGNALHWGILVILLASFHAEEVCAIQRSQLLSLSTMEQCAGGEFKAFGHVPQRNLL